MMNQQESQRYERIRAFSLDDGHSALPFSARLARENGWSLDYAGRVIDEYKKFMFLAVAAGHPVTPSEQIDQAWHLHLVYTDSYWRVFCGQVLGKPVHHGPTMGGASELEKYRDWYQRTKASYQRRFKQTPPGDIWPGADIRFGDDLHFRRVNIRHCWVIPKPRAKSWAVPGVGFLVVILFVLGLKLGIVGDRQSALHLSMLGQIHSEVGWFNAVAMEELLLWIGMPLLVILVILGLSFGNRCPTCGQRRALGKTGKREKGGLFKAGRVEWKCKSCGYCLWKNEQSGGCGGCGCGGGCGGCGGCGG